MNAEVLSSGLTFFVLPHTFREREIVDAVRNHLKHLPGYKYFTLAGDPAASAGPPAVSVDDMVTAWRRVAEFAANGSNVVLFCLQNGSKSLLLKSPATGKIVVALFRSKISDRRYHEFLAAQLGQPKNELAAAFSAIPEFSCGNLAELFAHLARHQIEDLQNLRKSANVLATRYTQTSDTDHPYAFDIRVFALLHTLRILLKDMKLHLLIHDCDCPADEDVFKLYVYHTTESIPRRPPIFAAPATSQMRDRLSAVLRKMEPNRLNDNIESEIGEILKIDSLHLKTSAFRWSNRFQLPELGIEALLEFSGPAVDRTFANLVSAAVHAALDVSDHQAINSLKERASFGNARVANEFRQLVDLYQFGLPGALTDVQNGGDEKWRQIFRTLGRTVRWLGPGSLTESTSSVLCGTVLDPIAECHGNHGRLNPTQVESSIAAFSDKVREENFAF
jgi:hypothetical protein